MLSPTKIPNWVLWCAEKRAGKITKIPYTTKMTPASSTDPITWDTFDAAQEAQKKYNTTGIGFVLPLDDTIIAIDLDKNIKDNTVVKYKDFIEKANTYTEYSPSGTGLHLFLYVPEGIKLKAHRSKKAEGFECYSSGRYMTYTGNVFYQKPIRKVTADEAENILSLAGYPWKDTSTDQTAHTIMDDQEILNRMFNSKNGAKISKLYNGDVSSHNDDTSSADMALCMHLAFWTQKDAEMMKRIWLSSPLASREKAQKRKDYQDMTISHAIAATNDTYSPTDKENIVSTLELMVNNKNVPFVNIENIYRIIKQDELLAGSIRYNDFTLEEETNLGTKQNDKEWHSIQREDIAYITRHIQKTYPYFERVQKQYVEDSVAVYAQENRVNPIKDWIESLEWDGHHRLDHWLSYTYGVADDAYHSAVGANWFKGLAKRIVSPGSKFDYMLILEGPQDWKKSSSLIVLGKNYHVETVLSPDNKDFQMILKKNIIVEFSEGYTMNRADSRLLKSIISSQEDQFRAPFGRAIQEVKRRCVFAMTTNENQYLRDETGNRRYLPVVLQKPADLQWLEQNVDQLYAEAYKRSILDKEVYWEFPKEAAEIQESKMVENAYADDLVNWYAELTEEQRINGVTALEAYQKVWLGGTPMGREMSPAHVMKVTSAFTSILKLYKKVSMVNGKRANRWFASKETMEIINCVEPDIVEKAYNNF